MDQREKRTAEEKKKRTWTLLKIAEILYEERLLTREEQSRFIRSIRRM